MRKNFQCVNDVSEVSYILEPLARNVVVIDGADIYEKLCPVSKLTGKRESPFKLLQKLSGADSALLNSVLQELPTVDSNPNLTDADRAQFLSLRLCDGTPAEQALLAEKLMFDINALGLSVEKSEAVAQVADSTIRFDSGSENSNAE